MVGGRIEDEAGARDSAERDEIRADIRHAYERGRADERAGRRRHPLFMTLTFACAIVGLVVLVLAGMNGSFQGGGAMLDNGLQIARARAAPAAKEAADTAGQQVRDAAQSVRAKSRNAAG